MTTTREKLAPSCVTHFSLSCLLWTRLSLSASLPGFPFRARPCIAITQDNVSKKEGEGGGRPSFEIGPPPNLLACLAGETKWISRPLGTIPPSRPTNVRPPIYFRPSLPPSTASFLCSIHFPLQPSSLFVRDAINLYPESCRSSLKGWRGREERRAP